MYEARSRYAWQDNQHADSKVSQTQLRSYMQVHKWKDPAVTTCKTRYTTFTVTQSITPCETQSTGFLQSIVRHNRLKASSFPGVWQNT